MTAEELSDFVRWASALDPGENHGPQFISDVIRTMSDEELAHVEREADDAHLLKVVELERTRRRDASGA